MGIENESSSDAVPSGAITNVTSAGTIGAESQDNTSSEASDNNQTSAPSATEDSSTSSSPITPRTTEENLNGTTSKSGAVASVATPDVSAGDEKHPDAVKLKFIFANRDGLTVIVSCKVTDSVGEVKGFLMSMWPDTLSPCVEGDRIRLICMGKGILMPDTKSLAACEVPVFETHATPINVSVRPDHIAASSDQRGGAMKGNGTVSSSGDGSGNNSRSTTQAGVQQGCSCVIS